MCKEERQMSKRKKEKIDGLSADDRRKLASAIRKVWSWSYPRRLAIKRCLDKQGFTRCEKCKKRTPRIKVDHIIPCGPVDSDGFIKRLFVPSSGLQCLCKKDHDAKTKLEKGIEAKSCWREE
jgi:hypothetical protein